MSLTWEDGYRAAVEDFETHGFEFAQERVKAHDAQLSIKPDPDDAWCGDCGAKLEAVRPGKHQHVGECPSKCRHCGIPLPLRPGAQHWSECPHHPPAPDSAGESQS